MNISTRHPRALALVSLLALTAACNPSSPVEPSTPTSPSTPIGGTPATSITIFGTVDSVSGTCPSLTLSINGTVIKTTGATAFGTIGGCAAIKTGDAGGVTGVRQSDDTILASFVSLVTPSPFPVTFSGSVASLSGTCPVLVLSIGVIAVETDAATAFNGKACADLKKGDQVTVTGTRTTGPVKAAQIDFGGGSSAPTTVSVFGTVDNLGGVCPALTMTINGTTVTTTAGTFFGGSGGCGGIRNGYTGGAAGIRQPDGSVRATYVSLNPK